MIYWITQYGVLLVLSLMTALLILIFRNQVEILRLFNQRYDRAMSERGNQKRSKRS